MYAKCEDILGENHIESRSYEGLQKAIPGIIKEIIDENGKLIEEREDIIDRGKFELRKSSKIKEIIAKKARECEEIIEEEINSGYKKEKRKNIEERINKRIQNAENDFINPRGATFHILYTAPKNMGLPKGDQLLFIQKQIEKDLWEKLREYDKKGKPIKTQPEEVENEEEAKVEEEYNKWLKEKAIPSWNKTIEEIQKGKTNFFKIEEYDPETKKGTGTTEVSFNREPSPKSRETEQKKNSWGTTRPGTRARIKSFKSRIKSEIDRILPPYSPF
jgi:hypothetical protein